MADDRTLAIPVPLSTLCEAYAEACVKYREGCKVLSEAASRLQAAMPTDGQSHSSNGGVLHKYDLVAIPDSDKVLAHWKSQVWRWIISRCRLDGCMTEKRKRELADQLENVNSLPDITEANVIEVVRNLTLMTPEHTREVYEEAVKFITPPGGGYTGYKTNEKRALALNDTVIITYGLEERSWGTNWRAGYNHQTALSGLDRVFHMLAGVPVKDTHNGDLVDAINTTPRSQTSGESRFFRFKCYANRNLHLKIKDMKLLRELYARAGWSNRVSTASPKS